MVVVGRHRLKQLYCVRMMRLLQMALAGQDFTLVDRIDWDSGQVHMKGEEYANRTQRSPWAGQGVHGDAMAKFLGRSP